MPTSSSTVRSLVLVAALASAVVPAPAFAAARQVGPSALDPTTSSMAIQVPGGTQRVTLRLRDMDVADALRLIANRGNLSFFVGPDVSGKINTDFYNEEINTILASMVTTNFLSFQQVGSTFVVTTANAAGLGGIRVYPLHFGDAQTMGPLLLSAIRSTGAKPMDDQIKYDSRANALIVSGSDYMLDQVGRLLTSLDKAPNYKIFRLSYIKAEEAQDLLFKSMGVKTVPNKRDNSLIAVGSNETLGTIAKALDQIDRRMRQVLVDVKLVELSSSARNLLGVSFSAASGMVDTRFTGDETTPTPITFDPNKSNVTNWNATVNALVKDKKARVLASPTVIIMDSAPAKSKITVNDEVVSRVTQTTIPNTNGPPTVATNPEIGPGTSIDLDIAGTITPDGLVSLDLNTVVSYAKAAVPGPGGTILATPRSSRTLTIPQVRIRDGETLIIGGINQEQTSDTTSKYPILGDIPFLGSLFRTSDRNRETTELIVMLTPRVVAEGDTVPKAAPKTSAK